MLWAMDTPKGLLAVMTYRKDLFEAETIQAAMRSLRSVLLAAVRAPHTALDDLADVPPDLPLSDVFVAPPAVSDVFVAPPAVAPPAVLPAVPPAVSDVFVAPPLSPWAPDDTALRWQAAFENSGRKTAAIALPAQERMAALVGALRAGMRVALLEPDAPQALLDRWISSLGAVAVAGLPSAVGTAGSSGPFTSGAARGSDAAVTAGGQPSPMIAVTAGGQASSAPPKQGTLIVVRALDRSDTTAPVEVPADALTRAVAAVAARLEPKAVAAAGSASLPHTAFAMLVAAHSEAAWVPLAKGADLATLPPETALFAAPEILRAMAAIPRALRAVSIGQIDPEPLRAKGARVFVATGLPEAGIVSLLSEKGVSASPSVVLDARVVDDRGRACPPGVPGSLELAGLQTPWRARQRGSGTIDVLSRSGGKVELKGLALSPDRVEAVLAAHPAVERARAGFRPLRGEQRLAAWYQLRAGANATETELRRHLRSTLLAEAVPDALVEIDTPAGSQNLPDPFPSARTPRIAPRTAA